MHMQVITMNLCRLWKSQKLIQIWHVSGRNDFSKVIHHRKTEAGRRRRNPQVIRLKSWQDCGIPSLLAVAEEIYQWCVSITDASIATLKPLATLVRRYFRETSKVDKQEVDIVIIGKITPENWQQFPNVFGVCFNIAISPEHNSVAKYWTYNCLENRKQTANAGGWLLPCVNSIYLTSVYFGFIKILSGLSRLYPHNSDFFSGLLTGLFRFILRLYPVYSDFRHFIQTLSGLFKLYPVYSKYIQFIQNLSGLFRLYSVYLGFIWFYSENVFRFYLLYLGCDRLIQAVSGFSGFTRFMELAPFRSPHQRVIRKFVW